MFYEDDEELIYYEEQKQVKNFIGINNTIDIDEKELKVGDKIVIYFYSCSQKYIYQLYPKYGKIIKNINKENNEFSLRNIKLKNNKTEYYASHGGVCLYSDGFEYRIVKLI